MSDITIIKVKLIKEGEKLEVAFKETGALKSLVDKVCESRVHPDLKNAVDALAVHFAILSDYITVKRARDKEELEKFVMIGYSIGGKEEEEGITITGQRKTSYGKKLTLNTPFLLLESSGETYSLIGDLNSKIKTIEDEVLKYLTEGKKAPDPQTSMFPPEPVTNVKIDHPQELYDGDGGKEKKINGKKKVPQSAATPNGEA